MSDPGRRRCRTAKNLTPVGKGALLRSAPRNPPEGGKLWREGTRGTRCQTRRVTPPSDVTGSEESIANLGRTAAAGWFPVRGLVSPVIQTPQSGSVARVGAGRLPRQRGPCRARSLQGSGDLVRRRGGARRRRRRKGRRVSPIPTTRRRAGREEKESPRTPGPRKGCRRGHARSPRKGALAWRLNGDVRPTCVQRFRATSRGSGSATA